MLMVVAQAFRLMEFHLIRLYLQEHFWYQCSRRGKHSTLHSVSGSLHLGVIDIVFLHLIVQSKSYGPAYVPAVCPEGVSEYFEMVLIVLCHVI